jgi:hypothetical protein
MKTTEWESFEEVLQSKTVSITSCGPLHGPVNAFSIKRDENLRILLETVSDGLSTSSAPEIPAGSVRASNDAVTFSGVLAGGTATALGITPYGTSLTIHPDPYKSVKTELSRVDAVRWAADGDRECIYTIDWLENVPSSFIWPDFTESKVEKSDRTTFKSFGYEVVMESTDGSGENDRGCVHLKIDGLDIFFGRYAKKDVPHVKSPGYILYSGKPNEDLREKLINSLSFAMGRYLIYLGHTGFDKHWGAVSTEAVSASTLSGAATRLISAPAAPLGLTYEREINSVLLQRFIEAIFKIYDSYSLRSVFWGYWHAIAAPAHMASVHFGAVIEALQESFFKIEETASKKIIAESAWENLSAQFIAEVEKIDASVEEKSILTNKLKGLNVVPQSVLMERFLDLLKISIGEVEQRAWKKGRNRAAHGRKIKTNEYVSVIRENKVLQILLNRMILAISKCADFYHDYYTLKNPIRPLIQPIPDDQRERL